MSWNALTKPTKAAVIFALLGFVVTLSSTQTSSTPSGSSCSYMDVGALIFGALAMAAGGFGALKSLALERNKQLNLALCVGADLLGVLHIARGLGLIGGPC